MTFGSGAGVVILTTAIGGCAGAAIAALLIQLLHISNFEGGSGYFAVFVTGFGIIGGFLVGLITAMSVRSGFWVAQGYATAIVLALSICAVLLPVVLNDEGPRLDNQKIVLEVELKCPPDWKPDNFSRSDYGAGFWLQRSSESGNNDRLGGVKFEPVQELGGQWVVTGTADLFYTTSPRYVRVYVGHKIDRTLKIPLPRHPSREFLQWSKWNSEADGYQSRFRIQREAEYAEAHPDRRAAYREARAKDLAALPADAPMAQWLPFFEDYDAHPVSAEQWEHQEIDAVNARPNELAPLLRSSDPTVVRRAVFAAETLKEVPASLIEPLAVSGRHAVELIQQARASSLPDDPDLMAESRAYTFFYYWNDAMDHAGSAAASARRPLLEQIAREVKENRGKDGLNLIAEQVTAALAKL